jgi:hypothetical protein
MEHLHDVGGHPTVIRLLPTVLVLTVSWNPVRPGVWQREVAMARDGPLSVVRAVVVRLDPSRVHFALSSVRGDYGLRGRWTIDSLPANGMVAFNAGQFAGLAPWGWLVQDGVEVQPPGSGSLGMAFVIDSADGRPPHAERVGAVAARGLAFSLPDRCGGKAAVELQAPGRCVICSS